MIDKARIFLTAIAKKVLAAANIEPALVKALIKSPAPVHGGPKVRRFPWPRRRHFDRRERGAVMRLIDREIRHGQAMIYNGPEKDAYCKTFADYMGGGFVETVNSGTNALYVALRALDLEPGSEVVVSPITDPGGTMPVALIQCIPIAADSDPGSLNTSAGQIEKVLTDRTEAIIVTHVGGCPVDMVPILELAAARGIAVVEDCAQAHGSTYKGRMLGTLGRISAFSTMFGKQHSTGAQGGIVFTADTLLFARVRQVADRGKPHGTVGNPANVVASLNFNQDEISMAIGRVQLEKLPAAIEARRAFVSTLESELRDMHCVSVVGDPPQATNSYWFLMLRFDSADVCCTSAEFAAALEEEGIGGASGGYPFYPTDQPWYRDAVVFGGSGLPWSALPGRPKPSYFELPNAHEANRTIVRVEIHESLGAREAKDLAKAVKKTAKYYSAR